MQQYLGLMTRVLEHGDRKQNPFGTGTLSVFGHQMRFDLNAGFPLTTTNRVRPESVIRELLWFLHGSPTIAAPASPVTNSVRAEKGEHWWPNADERHLGQVEQAFDQICRKPDTRRITLSTASFQFYVCDGELSCQLCQRTAYLHHLPFNIASYALMVMIIAQVCGLRVGDFVYTLGEVHLYLYHLDAAREQLSRETYPLPQIRLNTDVSDLFMFGADDFEIINYQHHPHIDVPV